MPTIRLTRVKGLFLAVSGQVTGEDMEAGLAHGTHTLSVRMTDMFGQTYELRRVFRVRDGANLPAPGS